MTRYAFVKDYPDQWCAVIVEVADGETTGDVIDFAFRASKIEIDAYVNSKLGSHVTVYEAPEGLAS